jgi:hypothetical protein
LADIVDMAIEELGGQRYELPVSVVRFATPGALSLPGVPLTV